MSTLLPDTGSIDDVLKGTGTASARDPRRALYLKKQHFGNTLLRVCEVHDVLAYANSYLIKAAGMPRMPACLLSNISSLLPIGVRDCTTILPGSFVLAFIDENIPFAIIVGVIPGINGASNLSLPDSIVPAGHAGMFVDPAHFGALQERSAHGYIDVSAGRPVDGLPGDWGAINELGVGFIVGKLLCMMRAGEFCKFEMHYEDQLARMVAYNYEMFTSGSERTMFNDEGEFTDIEGVNPYPWEAAGALKGNPFELTEGVLEGDNAKFGVEPISEKQTGFWRFRSFCGFLGDLKRNYVLGPVPELEYMEFGREDTPYVGLLEERYGTDGAYQLRSAKSIGFEKTIYIPVPYEKLPRDNPMGDTGFEDPAGKGGDYNTAEIPEAKSPSAAAASIHDAQAFISQHLTAQGVNTRTKDWGVEDPPVMPGGLDSEMSPITPFPEFECKFPESEEYEVDHRTTRRYYKSKASIDILDDGSVAIQDAYGSSIKLIGGNIELSCPGSVIARPGRDFISFAGQDTILKSHNNVDITSAAGNIRQKAEKNFMILGGNSGTSGGVLIENRATGEPSFETVGDDVNVGGLLFKSATSDVVMWGKDLIMQSFGDVTIDANDSKGDVTLYANNFDRYLRAGSTEIVAPRGLRSTPVSEISYTNLSAAGFISYGGRTTLMSSSIEFYPRRTADSEGVQLNHWGNASIRGAYMATGDFGPTRNVDYSSAVSGLSTVTSRMKDDAAKTEQSNRESGEYLNEDTGTRVGVSFRTASELGTSGGFIFYETNWQRAFRLAGGADTFEESSVYAFVNREGRPAGTQTMPYPGKEVWESGDHFAKITKSKYYDDESGTPKPRTDSAFKSSELPEIEEDTFEGNYLVNSRMSS